jgi:peroxiredoxin Q/BCP
VISRRAALLGLGAIGAGATKAVAAVEVGDMAPDFSLPATNGKTVTLAQYKGKSNVVLAFYPKAFTGG